MEWRDIDEIPDDILEELKEAMEEITPRMRRRGRAKLPSNREIAEAVIEAARAWEGSPEDFPDAVRSLLEDWGYNTRYVNDKRIWRIYETLVRRGAMRDTLGVVEW
ncbi:MAG: hypothetical protein F7B18_02180 [Desulfurococcales archaeon]|nr:hypothetical protein [Desulfurococcales archaeon]